MDEGQTGSISKLEEEMESFWQQNHLLEPELEQLEQKLS